jgi:hypothetical protein
MFCQSCGCELPESARFCRQCGAPISPVSLHKPAARSGRRSWRAKALGVALAIFAVLALIGIFSDHHDVKQFLPMTAEQILGSYAAPPVPLRSYTTTDGATVRLYSSTCHKISFEERGGGLTRYSIEFEPYAEDRPVCAVVVPAKFGLFIGDATGADPKDILPIMEQLGGSNAWSPEPSEAVFNGIRLTRQVKDGSLVLQAEAD